MLETAPKDTPIEIGQKLIQNSEDILEDITSYRRLVGKPIYLTSTRPHICFVVGRLSQFLDSPTKAHMNAAIRFLKYLKNSPGDGLFFSARSNHNIIGYSNSDWGSCKDNRKSISAYCFFIRDGLISWKSKKQKLYQDLQQKQSIGRLPLQPVKPNFLETCSQALEFPILKPLPFSVITNLPFISQTILYSTREQSI
jgi:hypothetical protein